MRRLARLMRAVTVVARMSALGLLLATLSVPLVAQAGQNDGADPNGDGYTAEVSIHFTGTGVPGGSETRTVSVSPSCWWAPAAGDYTDAVKMLAWYDQVTGGQQTTGNLDDYGPRSVWKAAADAETAGTAHVSWYRAYCKDQADYTKFGISAVDLSGSGDGDVGPVDGGLGTWVTYLYHPFNAGEPIPAPRVPPEELAKAARDVMTIPEPATDRNPKIKSPGAPTLVGLPTWFWVTNPLAVGGTGGTLDVRASLEQPDGEVWALVVAATGGLSITSNYGSTKCAPDLALQAYGNNVSPANACTIVFTHAATSLGLTASTDWDATWTGSGNTGGGLDPLHQQINEQLAVAEVQNIVTR